MASVGGFDEDGHIPRPRIKRDDPEHRLQRECKRYLIIAAPPDLYWTAVDHAGQRTQRTGAALKARGVKPGQADLRFIWRGRAIEVELKAPKGRQSDEQVETERGVTQAGGIYQIARSVKELDEILRWAGVSLRTQPL